MRTSAGAEGGVVHGATRTVSEVGEVHTALVMPVVAAESLCRLAEQFPRARVSTGVAHITIATPFLAEDRLTSTLLGMLREIAGSVPSFRFELNRCAAFANGWVYFAPRDPAPFLELTAAVRRDFDAVVPYGGEHAELVPHVSICTERGPTRRRDTIAALESSLPLLADADALMLVRSGPDDVESARFPLGTRR